jgi:hypothetical protein
MYEHSLEVSALLGVSNRLESAAQISARSSSFGGDRKLVFLIEFKAFFNGVGVSDDISSVSYLTRGGVVNNSRWWFDKGEEEQLMAALRNVRGGVSNNWKFIKPLSRSIGDVKGEDSSNTLSDVDDDDCKGVDAEDCKEVEGCSSTFNCKQDCENINIFISVAMGTNNFKKSLTLLFGVEVTMKDPNPESISSFTTNLFFLGRPGSNQIQSFKHKTITCHYGNGFLKKHL